MDAVILAGGKGTRLYPYTVSIPKPLVPLGEVPIIEIVLRQLVKHGVTRAHLALGYLAELLMAYFSQVDHRLDLELIYSIEEAPLGTVGPLSKMEDLGETFLALNGDVLTTLPFSDLVAFHRRSGCIATFAVKNRSVPVNFGVVEISDDGRIVGHQEKPDLHLNVGMGVCVFERDVAGFIPEGVRFDIPDLVHALLEAGESLAAYVSDDYWMDIGRPEDYAQAQEDFTVGPERFL